MLDLRLPIGWFFAIVGVLLLAMGIFAPETHAPFIAVNVNLYCGLSMTLFGAFLLLLAARAARRRS
jgi:predicted phage tail protein